MAIDNILVFGDSFMFGNDLSDCCKVDVGKRQKTGGSMSTWPALISKRLGLGYESAAEGGIGNQYIASQIFSYADNVSLAVINWTWIDRFDYYSDDLTDDLIKTLRPSKDTELERFYYQNLHSERCDKLRSLSLIYASIHWLLESNIPFIMTIMDPTLLDDQWNVDQGILNLQSKVRQHISWFPNNQTFLEWSRSNGYPESDNWHPLEQAHQEAAKYWKPIYENVINTHITTTKD